MSVPASIDGTLDRLGLRLLHLDETESTNQVAGEHARQARPGGLLVWADAQTAGRGRQGRTWLSCKGTGLYLSFLRRPARPATDAFLWTLLAGVSVQSAVVQHREAAWLKWPNDVFLGDKKLAGILCELQTGPPGRIDSIVVGIGLNLLDPPGGWPDELHGRADSLWGTAAAAMEEHRESLVLSIATHFVALEQDLLAHGAGALLAKYRCAMDRMLGRRVTVETGAGEQQATVRGISDKGALEVVDEVGQPRTLLAGDVHLLAHPSAGP